MRILWVLAKISGRLRFSHRIFGPTDCEVSALPQRSRMRSAPIAPSARRSPVRRGCRRRRARRSSAARRRRRPAACRGRWRWCRRPGYRPAQPCCRRGACGDEGEVVPPVLARPVLGPAGLRHQHLVRLGGAGDDPALLVDEHALRFERADVDAEIVVHWVKSSRSRLKPASMPAIPATSSRVRPARSARSQTSSEEWV